MSNRLSNEQKCKERPMRTYDHAQWMLTNYGTQLGIFRTRKEAADWMRATGRDPQHHEIRRALVKVERQS